MRRLRHRVYLSLGSNIDPVENLRRAVELMRQTMPIQAITNTWETPPVGTSGDNYYNAAILALSVLTPTALKEQVLRPIEAKLGRVRTSDKYAPRPIDLDIILFDDELVDERLWTFAYLAIPLAEILPTLLNPETGLTLRQTADAMLRSQEAVPHPEVFPTRSSETR